ncbi:hypothetical protein RFI_07404 [Reticulomyxa filosa]|uniref:Uncharacterized protein n=1 Tax=Reticulomyxa filosa TaxID=46433 RepID=X6NUL1_RETFI|nr:hypothetical protein RFI_07404 [Reticulomyxa filosa]|eukprot:ETO29716.1 hypothetical protein RFI_07404 [Reticulomyxa filosa]
MDQQVQVEMIKRKKKRKKENANANDEASDQSDDEMIGAWMGRNCGGFCNELVKNSCSCSCNWSSCMRTLPVCQCYCLLVLLLVLLSGLLFLWNVEELRLFCQTYNEWKKLHVTQLENELNMRLQMEQMNYKSSIDIEKLVEDHQHVERMALIQLADNAVKKFIDSNTQKVQKWGIKPLALGTEVVEESKTSLNEHTLAHFRHEILGFVMGTLHARANLPLIATGNGNHNNNVPLIHNFPSGSNSNNHLFHSQQEDSQKCQDNDNCP